MRAHMSLCTCLTGFFLCTRGTALAEASTEVAFGLLEKTRSALVYKHKVGLLNTGFMCRFCPFDCCALKTYACCM